MLLVGGEHRIMALVILPIVFLVLVSGCTIPIGPQETTGGGVVIESFVTDLQVSEIYSGEPISFQLKFRNTGSVKAENVFAELFGLDEDWCCEAISEGSWEGNEKLPNEVKCRYTGNGHSLLPPNPQMGTVGESSVCTWTYKAPSIPKNLPSVPYTSTVRLFYNYRTILSKSITFGSHQDIKAIQDIGGSLPASTTSSTSSPISLSMNTNSPIRFWTVAGGSGEIKFSIEISIENVGGGIACATKPSTPKSCKLSGGGEEAKNKILLKITPGQGLELQDECRGFTSGKIITLWKGKSNSIACDIKASGLEAKGPVQKEILIEAEYEYAIDKETSIRVVGIE